MAETYSGQKHDLISLYEMLCKRCVALWLNQLIRNVVQEMCDPRLPIVDIYLNEWPQLTYFVQIFWQWFEVMLAQVVLVGRFYFLSCFLVRPKFLFLWIISFQCFEKMPGTKRFSPCILYLRTIGVINEAVTIIKKFSKTMCLFFQKYASNFWNIRLKKHFK